MDDLKHFIKYLLGRKNSETIAIAASNQQAGQLKTQMAKEMLDVKKDLDKVNQKILNSTAYKVAIATGGKKFNDGQLKH